MRESLTEHLAVLIIGFALCIASLGCIAIMLQDHIPPPTLTWTIGIGFAFWLPFAVRWVNNGTR